MIYVCIIEIVLLMFLSISSILKNHVFFNDVYRLKKNIENGNSNFINYYADNKKIILDKIHSDPKANKELNFIADNLLYCYKNYSKYSFNKKIEDALKENTFNNAINILYGDAISSMNNFYNMIEKEKNDWKYY